MFFILLLIVTILVLFPRRKRRVSFGDDTLICDSLTHYKYLKKKRPSLFTNVRFVKYTT